jgi:hypothetical protein
MTNPYLRLAPDALAGVWGMRAAELMPLDDEADEPVTSARDTAFMLLAGAMRVAPDELPQCDWLLAHANDESAARIRLEVLKRAASLAIPEHPDLWLKFWLLDLHAKGRIDVYRALESDEGLCELLRHLQHIVWVSGSATSGLMQRHDGAPGAR